MVAPRWFLAAAAATAPPAALTTAGSSSSSSGQQGPLGRLAAAVAALEPHRGAVNGAGPGAAAGSSWEHGAGVYAAFLYLRDLYVGLGRSTKVSAGGWWGCVRCLGGSTQGGWMGGAKRAAAAHRRVVVLWVAGGMQG